MNKLRIFKETILPETLNPSSLYFITDTVNTDYVELYLTDKNGLNARRIPSRTDISNMISSAVNAIEPTAPNGSSSLIVVNDITERDSTNIENDSFVFVIDATGDDTVTSGSATYLYRTSGEWIKISEHESMDLVLSWEKITGKPSSSASAIDMAVSQTHTHQNKSIIDKISQNEFGDLTYDGNLLPNKLDTENW